MRKRPQYLIAMLASVLWSASCAAADATRAEQGKQVYEREGCKMCHSLQGVGNPRQPLDDVGTRLSPPDIRKWIVAPQEMKPGVKKKSYTLSEPDLDALVEYLIKPTP